VSFPSPIKPVEFIAQIQTRQQYARLSIHVPR
jgi:hypothetical protein